MKYRQLTKEQFEGLHQEFARFLAFQSIDKKEWRKLKKEKLQVAEEEINIFSDVVWDDVLTRTEYLEHFSPKLINLFKCNINKIDRIVIKINKDVNVTVTEQKGFEWLLKNTDNEALEFFNGSKEYVSERNLEIFDLIEKGSFISKEELYKYFNLLITKRC